MAPVCLEYRKRAMRITHEEFVGEQAKFDAAMATYVYRDAVAEIQSAKHLPKILALQTLTNLTEYIVNLAGEISSAE
jgi:hypothetical protein